MGYLHTVRLTEKANTGMDSHLIFDVIELSGDALPARLRAVYARVDNPDAVARQWCLRNTVGVAVAVREDVHDAEPANVRLLLHSGVELAGEWIVTYFPTVTT